ncbi:phosphatidylinositol-specific phospholipase C domain-containing protein [Streptomyces sp. LS1784]|uniref:phosphatidylinositol-specific phospholipase C domain-containing protein n=1 Tax=Streptomyces sp. LS1784 TaxID=2851533 RepID=UPI001CCEBEE7|nr:phosphatidylinositol-specific phospholipase C domain-containing protein [Streptomyces sp. LS1784]
MRTSGAVPRRGTDRRARLLRLFALPVIPLLVLASMLTAPTGATAASSKYGNARYHQWSWVTSHNAYANNWNGFPVPPNQSQSIQQQLEGGVRGLMLDTWDPKGTAPVEMCHGSTSLCYEEFKSGLLTIVNFLQKNPQEVVTVFLENYASPQTLSKTITDMLDAKGAGKLLFNQNDWGIFSSNWPRLRDMVAANQRLVIFQDSWSDQAVGSGTLMNTWTHTVENRYSYGLGQPYGCEPRGESQPLNQNPMPGTSNLTPLFTMNQFSSDNLDPEAYAKIDNGSQLKSRIEKSCRPAAGRNPNFVAVDHYQLSDKSGNTPLSVVDELNRDNYVFEPDPAVWVVTDSKQYVSTYNSNRCMVRGDEFPDGSGGLVTQRACANPAPSSHQWTATKPNYDGKGYYWIKAGNGSCLTVPYNNGTPPGDGTQLFWWPCETQWSSGNQLWNVMPTNIDSNGNSRGYYFINQWTGRCLTLDPATTGDKAGKVTQAACPKR